MLRGHSTLFSNIFPLAIIPESARKGQRNVFIEERDNALACRYFYYIQVRRFRYDDCLACLEKEFFITASVIVQRLNEKQKLIKAMIASKETLAELKKEYPGFSWIVKQL